MNLYHIVGAIITVALVIACVISYRFYKRIARRCHRKKCGRIGVERVCKILLPPDETISLKSSEGNRRWFIRRPVKLTFTTCKCKWVELVKIDTDPISLWHLLWAKRFHKEQFYLEEPELIRAAHHKLRQLYLGGKHEKLDSESTDAPPLSLYGLFRDSLEEIGEILEEMGGGEQENL